MEDTAPTTKIGLLDMPPEILGKIYGYLRHTKDGGLSRHFSNIITLNKALLPIFHEHGYRDVTIDDMYALHQFAPTIAGRPEFGRLVRSLEVKEFRSFSHDDHTLVRTMWPLLSSLRVLRLDRVDFVEVFLADVSSGVVRPELNGLHLSLPPHLNSASNEWDTLWTAVPELAYLAIVCHPDDPLDDRHLPVAPPSFNTKLRALTVSGFDDVRRPAIARFVNRFPALEELCTQAVYDWDGFDTGAFVAGLRLPGLLKFAHVARGRLGEVVECFDLRQLTQLQEAVFTVGTLPKCTLRLPPSLKVLRWVDDNSPVRAISDVMAARSGALELVEIGVTDGDAYVAEPGRTADGLVARSDLRGWADRLPVPKSSWLEGVRRLVAVASRTGVRLEGTALDVLAYEDAVLARDAAQRET